MGDVATMRGYIKLLQFYFKFRIIITTHTCFCVSTVRSELLSLL